MKKPATALNVDHLRSRLKLKSFQSNSLLKAHHAQAINQLESAGVRVRNLRDHATKVLASGATLASIMLPPAHISSLSLRPPDISENSPFIPTDANSSLKNDLAAILPPKVSPLSSETELKVSHIIKSTYGVVATPELEGNRLNDNYGYIGAEQHLPRFPGDSIALHAEYQRSGLTPGRGAWGYFAPSKTQLTEDLIEKEKYYFAVQTLYLRDWSTRLSYLRDWYKHRKMIAINPANGKAIIGVIADSGPAWWTGKVFGGSPEVMGYLNMKDGRQKGPVILYFVDDPDNQVPLGPLEYNLLNPPQLVAS